MDQASFGLRLRVQRERQQISLAAIAQSTKIKESLLVGLERGDVSQWPAGIFRRAFLREYACAIGLPPEETVSEFVGIFPEGDSRGSAGPAAAAELRLTLVDSGRSWARPWVLRAIAGSAEFLVFALIAMAAGLVLPVSPLTVGGVLGFAYYAMATLVLGQSPMLWFMSDLGNGIRSSQGTLNQGTNSRVLLHIVSLPGRTDSGASALDFDSEPVRSVASS